MLHWIHHVVFDPLSAWERFKIELELFPLQVLILIGVGMACKRRK